VLIPLHWMSTTGAFGLLTLGAGVLLSLLPMVARRRMRLVPLLAVIGLWIVGDALYVLKDRTAPWFPSGAANFRVVRNALSLVEAAVPLSLALLIRPRLAPAIGALCGLVGLLFFILGGLGLITSLGEDRHLWISVARISGAFLLEPDGRLPVARWLWCAGAALIALPSWKQLALLARQQPSSSSTDLSFTLLGLGLSSLAMGIFFWHQSDDAHRGYAYGFMSLSAVVAPYLAFGERRAATARYGRHALAAVNTVVAVWLATGVAGGDFPEGSQSLASDALAEILLLLLFLIPPAVLLHLFARWVVGRFREP